MTSPRDIAPHPLAKAVSYSSLSVSPTATFQSPPSSSQGGGFMAGVLAQSAAAAKQLKPFNTEDVKILLLENVNQTGRDILKGQGYQVEFLKTSLPEDQLIEKIR
jgi:D-3-phosphoglycerate dehydrogenase